METIIIRGESKPNARLLLELAKKLNFSVVTLKDDEAEDLGISISIREGINSGLLTEGEKAGFLSDPYG